MTVDKFIAARKKFSWSANFFRIAFFNYSFHFLLCLQLLGNNFVGMPSLYTPEPELTGSINYVNQHAFEQKNLGRWPHFRPSNGSSALYLFNKWEFIRSLLVIVTLHAHHHVILGDFLNSLVKSWPSHKPWPIKAGLVGSYTWPSLLHFLRKSFFPILPLNITLQVRVKVFAKTWTCDETFVGQLNLYKYLVIMF